MDPNRIVLAIRHCGRVRAFKHGKSLHSRLIQTGSLSNVFLVNNLMSMYVDFSYLNDAQKLFDEMLNRNVVTWTTMVSAYTNGGRPEKALDLYTQMVESESDRPNVFMYSAVVKACGIMGDLELGKLIQKSIFSDKLEFDIVLMNALLDMYVKCGNLNYAREVFDEMLHKNSTSWNTVILGYCKAGLMEEAVDLFDQMPEPNVASWNTVITGLVDGGSLCGLEFVCMMHREGFKLDDFTFPCALKTCAFHDFLGFGKQIHCCIIKSGFESSCFCMSALVDMYSNCNSLIEAIKLFDQYSSSNESISPSLALWNSMLSGFVVSKNNKAALDLVSQIHCLGVLIDSYTFSGALKVCINLLSLRLGLQVHGLAVTYGYELDYIVGSILVDLYAKVGNTMDALGLFHRLPKKDIVAWSGLITGCAKLGLNSLCFSLFRDMINLDLEVDQFVISSVLKACSGLASLGCGKQVHAFCIKSGYESEGVTLTSIIDMYSKCGEIDDGLALFNYVPERDIICWTGIIVGCAQNGREEEAITFFHKMVHSGLKPNEITFLGVLSACRHAGLVEEAWTTFKSMKTEYELEPHLDHYYCIIDLLGHAGCFNEAEKLISEMPFEPDRSIWGSLLEACGIHKNRNLVHFIAERLLVAAPGDPSVYVMLSNAYANLEMWDSLTKVREAVKEVGTKEVGKSWIEFSN